MKILILLSCLFLFVLETGVNCADGDWSHEDQRSWRDHYPMCDGDRQSPINLRNCESIKANNMPRLIWTGFKTSRDQVCIDVEDESVRVSCDWRSGRDEEKDVIPKISGGPLKTQYQLEDIHFHWGCDDTDGSEHAINSRKYALEGHFVFYSCKYKSIREAIKSKSSEALCVVAILYNVGPRGDAGINVIANPLRNCEFGRNFWNETLNLNDFGLRFSGDYYTYKGSLTTPGCEQVVRWIVSNDIRHVNPMQLRAFRNQNYGDRKRRVKENFRIIQLRNNRTVQYVESSRFRDEMDRHNIRFFN